MAESIGSLDWARRRGGILTRAEQWQYIVAGVGHQIGTTFKKALILGRGPIDMDQIVVPDSAACRHAAEHARDVCSPALVEHSHRCFWWGSLIGQRERLRPDPEMLYVAAMLHDVGLAMKTNNRCTCFTLQSAESAITAMAALGWSAPKCARLGDAITLHMNIAPPPTSYGPEARLLHAGAACDVVGSRLGEIPKNERRRVTDAHPRGSFAAEFLDHIRHEATMAPRTRVAILTTTLHLPTMVKRAPS